MDCPKCMGDEGNIFRFRRLPFAKRQFFRISFYFFCLFRTNVTNAQNRSDCVNHSLIIREPKINRGNRFCARRRLQFFFVTTVRPDNRPSVTQPLVYRSKILLKADSALLEKKRWPSDETSFR